jgi:hypothetical protein
MKPNTNSLVLWSNSRIQLIVTGLTERSKNKKTGGMIQTYIIRTDMSPLDAMRQDKDKAICGNCPLRGSTKKRTKRKGRTCYVNVGQASQALYKAVKNFGGSITKAKGKPGRLGSYGDPSFVPVPVWKRILNLLSGHTGYTHQWARPTTQAYSAFLMASVESVDAKKQANSRGWRTFRVMRQNESLQPDEDPLPRIRGGWQAHHMRKLPALQWQRHQSQKRGHLRPQREQSKPEVTHQPQRKHIMKTYSPMTYRTIANSFELWGEYVDPDGLDSKEQFESMTIDDKIEIIEGCFGPED